MYQSQQHNQRYQRPFSVPRPSSHQNHAHVNDLPQPISGNKRPYAPPVTAGVRRTGIQPPMKKHAPQPGSRPPVTPAAGTLTDDQLDTLLGEVDVDAIIAASQKVQQDNDILQESSRGVMRSEADVAVTVRPDPQQIGLNSLHSEGNERMNGVKPVTTVSGVQTGSAGSNHNQNTVDGNTGGNAGSKTFSNVDEAMIDSLFEGLDSSDFG